MTQPALALLVRFRSELSYEEVVRVIDDRAPDFRALDGLHQKYYLQDAESGEYAGFYLWNSPDDLAEYRESELRASIATAYQTVGEPRVELYKVIKPLRET